VVARFLNSKEGIRMTLFFLGLIAIIIGVGIIVSTIVPFIRRKKLQLTLIYGPQGHHRYVSITLIGNAAVVVAVVFGISSFMFIVSGLVTIFTNQISGYLWLTGVLLVISAFILAALLNKKDKEI
jgi:cytosine/uracil/thiamine/allantoin permease